MKESILLAEGITKKYGSYTALNNITLSVPKGSIFGLLGPNGAGKTTLMRMINQITAPDKGTLYFDGNTLGKDHIKFIGYLPEERGLYRKMKVGEQALYLAQLKGMSYKDAVKKLHFWFKHLGVSDWWNKRVEQLSKGMAQKVQFIITVIHEPKLLIFDEPFSGFDPINVAIIRDEILNLNNEGTTIIFSTHRMESVEEICSDIALMNHGEAILQGSIDEIKQTFTNNIYKIELAERVLKENPLFEILNQNENTFLIKPTSSDTKKEILHFLNTHYTIISFKNESANMEDIFIKAINDG